MIVLIVVLVVLAAAVLYVLGTYNSFIKTRNKAEEALSALDAHLKQRYDLIPNLVETVRGYAKHEEETLSRERTCSLEHSSPFSHSVRLTRI